MSQAASYSSSIGPLQAQLDAFLAKSPLKASPPILDTLIDEPLCM